MKNWRVRSGDLDKTVKAISASQAFGKAIQGYDGDLGFLAQCDPDGIESTEGTLYVSTEHLLRKLGMWEDSK